MIKGRCSETLTASRALHNLMRKILSAGLELLSLRLNLKILSTQQRGGSTGMPIDSP
jgi:hypothetical protein